MEVHARDATDQEETVATPPGAAPGQSDESKIQAAGFPPVTRTGTSRSDWAALVLPWVRRFATLFIALVAVLVGRLTWDEYVTAPWTRDGRIRVQVASIAPQVSGQIKDLRISDNQYVHRGDVLYVIDPFDFAVTLRTNTAQLQQREADLHVKDLQSERRRRLSDLATTPEEQQIFEGSAIQAKAEVDAAQQGVAQAEINLKRTEVRSTVNGYVTNLLLREGDYAHQGISNVSVIDTDSYWIDGYFEETKLSGLCVGDRAEAKLMGYSAPIIGYVSTVTRGVSVSNAAAGAQGLPNVDPVYTWVRLAQRVPVRIAIKEVPRDVPLVSGMTATVTVRSTPSAEGKTWIDRTKTELGKRILDVIDGPTLRPGCVPVRS